jgi:TonB family protein
MPRLRIRIELNRRMAGVPLTKMASVVEETHKFFHLLSEDVQIEAERGEWLASDFDAESLNFTAEYGGPVSAEQVRAFGAAFSGATSLRRATIAQFTRIAEFLGEDELVGFGLFQSDQETEPTEWRCLSKRDAMRFGEEIKLLAAAAGEQVQETQLPAVLPQVMNGSVAGRRLFKDRREREALAADPSKLVREMEASLSRRIGLLEGEVAEQTRKMQQTSVGPDLAQERFEKLLSAMETFWAQAPRQFPQLPAPEPVLDAQPAPQPVPQPVPEAQQAPEAQFAPPAPVAAEVQPVPEATPANEAPPAAAESPVQVQTPTPNLPAAPQKPRAWSVWGVAMAATAAILLGIAFPAAERQWTRFSSMETLPMVKPKPPAAPVLPSIPASQTPAAEKAAGKTVAEKSTEPFIGPLIPLDIPATVKSKIQSEVRVDVVVAIDRAGNVTGARVASTKGESAQLLETEALRAARQSRFRPAREGEKTVPSKMVLTFLFKPESNDF